MAEPRTLLLDQDVQQGLREVGGNVANGLAGLFVGRGPGGFVLIAGAVGAGMVRQAEGGMVAVSLTVNGARALRDRLNSLLGERDTEFPPEGLVIQ